MLNPGSVGLVFDTSVQTLPWGEYASIDSLNGVLSVERHRVSFDVHTFLQITLASGMDALSQVVS